MSNHWPHQPSPHDKKKWIRVGNIYLPESILQQSSSSRYLPVAEAITAEEVLGQRGTEQKAIELCQSIFWKDCISFASRISALLEKYGSEDTKLQIKLSQQIFKGNTRDRVIELLKSPHGAIKRSLFNSWQLLMFTKIALLFGSDDTKQNLGEKSRLEMLGDCFLVVNDLIGLGVDRVFYDNDTHLTEALIRNGAFFAREEAGNLLPRYYELFSVLPQKEDLKKSPHHTDIEAAFRKATGFDLDLFLALGFGIYSYYAPVEDLNLNKFVLNSSTFFSKTLVPDEIANKLLDHISISRDQFKEQYSAKYGESNLGNYFDFTLLRQRPLVRLDESIYVPVDICFLVERITSGIYWDICDSLCGQEKQRFMSFFGVILQKYLEELFRRVYPESRTTTNRVFYDIPYDGERAADVILFYGEEAVFIEVVVGRLRMEETMITGDLDAFRKDISTKVVDAARQLDRVIRDFVSKKLTLPGWSPINIKRYYPVAVTVSPLPIFLKTYDEVRRMVADAGYLISPNLAELEIVNIGELEIIEPLLESGRTLVKMLDSKTQDKFYRLVPLWHYLYATSDNRALRKGSGYLHKQRDEMFNKIRPLLFDIDDKQSENM